LFSLLFLSSLLVQDAEYSPNKLPGTVWRSHGFGNEQTTDRDEKNDMEIAKGNDGCKRQVT